MFIIHFVIAIVVTIVLASLVIKAILWLFAPKRPIVIIITTHNNAILGYLQEFADEVLPKTVSPNGSVMKITVKDMMATFSILTEDSTDPKYITKEHLRIFLKKVFFFCSNCIIYLVRHGESEANTKKNYTNPTLTPNGEDDAKKAGKAIQDDIEGNPKIICVSSPLTRAVQTMHHIKGVLGLFCLTILNVLCIESVRDMGRPIHTRGTKARYADEDAVRKGGVMETVVACNPTSPDLDVYRIDFICNPSISEVELEKLVSPNRLPPNVHDFPRTDASLLNKQLKNNWSKDAAWTSLDELVSKIIAAYA